MTRISISLIVVVLSALTAGCQTNAQTQETTCTVNAYRKNAEPLMNEFSDIVNEVNIRDSLSRQEARTKLLALQTRIAQVQCREKFPLKHETLEYSVKHLLDALNYADNEEYEKMSHSIDYALINVKQFQDWTVDVGE